MNNSVCQLNVFVDNDCLLGCGGRIDNANVPCDVKFPYLIPKTLYFMKLVVTYADCKRYEGKPYSCSNKPPLPKERVSKDHVFSYISIDYVGPIYVKNV